MLRPLAESLLEVVTVMHVETKVRLIKVGCYRVAMCLAPDRAKAGNSWTPERFTRRCQAESKTQCGAD